MPPRRQFRHLVATAIVCLAGNAAAGPLADELDATCRRLLDGCRLQATDGTMLYLPDGRANYQALWTRDFAYMVRYAGDLMPRKDIHACIEYTLRGQRADGVIPDRVEPDGTPVYVAGPKDHPMGEFNLDNAQFLIIAADEYRQRLLNTDPGLIDRPHNDPAEKWYLALKRGLDSIPLGPRGLVYNSPQKPHSPYGFTDTVGKTGDLFMESLLYWEATLRLAGWAQKAGHPEDVTELQARADRVVKAVDDLWDETSGAFYAASVDCRQLDVWANAYAIEAGFPLGTRRDRVLDFLHTNYSRCMFNGQVRHLLTPEHWQRMLAEVQPNRYQNGAYWATASGWVIGALAERDPELARAAFTLLMDYFRRHGVFECVHGDYRQLDSYVVSATNPRSAAQKLGY